MTVLPSQSRWRPRVLCDTNPMCYGSTATLLAIIDHLDATLTAVAEGVTAELLEQEPRIARVIRTKLKDPEAVLESLSGEAFDAVLVVNNQANIEAYIAKGWPVFFVDILFWYGAQKLERPVWRLAMRSFVQAFEGVDERLRELPFELRDRVTRVGPIVRVPGRTGRSGTLVNIGGARSRFVIPGTHSHYTRQVVDWVTELRDIVPAGGAYLAAGMDAIRTLEGMAIPPWLQVGTLDNASYLERLGNSSVLITAPGLNAVFEALYCGVELVFLPPQNASQVMQLAAYERAAIVRKGLNLDRLVPNFEVPRHMRDESELTERVLKALPLLHGEDVVRHLRLQLAELGHRERARTDFVSTLGPPGGKAVAESLLTWWGGR